MQRVRREITRLVSGSFLRFFAANLGGLVLDIGLAAVLHHAFGLPLIPAAAISLIVAAVVMYVVHEFWTFAGSARVLSLRRMAGTVMSGLGALVVRSLCLLASGVVLGIGEADAIAQLVAATGASFIFNYLVVKRIVGSVTDGPHRPERSPPA